MDRPEIFRGSAVVWDRRCSAFAGVMHGGRYGYDSLDIRKLAEGVELNEGNAVLRYERKVM